MSSDNAIKKTMPSPGNPPFWYGSFSAVWVYLPVPLAVLDDLLQGENENLRAFAFQDLGKSMGLMNFNFMTYGADSGINDPAAYADILKPISYNDKPPASFGVEPTHECEINILSYSAARKAQVPFGLSSSDFIRGHDHTKTIGNYRLWVPCDDRIAVYWGMHNFGENKLMTPPFVYQMPCWNNSSQPVWDVKIPAPMGEPAGNTLFHFVADDLKGRPGVEQGNQSEIIDLSLWPHAEEKPDTRRLVASRRNAFGVYNILTRDSKERMPGFELNIGNSSHVLVSELHRMLDQGGAIEPAGMMTYFSQPAVSESSLYYFDI
ncbi:MAG: hypothetical protein OES38_22250 [Gammaproteobacteria bacterium]|nr:hypothetical protein [Gammaproteobacteria bacterium]